MVVPYASEKPNLSYVRINQNTSDGTGPSIKTYITKGLVSSDPFVVNSSLLHPSLVAQPTARTTVETPYWNNLELPKDTQDGSKELSKSRETVSVESSLNTTPACAATSRGATPQEVVSARPEFKQTLKTVRLPLGAVLVKLNTQQPSTTNPSTNVIPTPLSSPSSLGSSPSLKIGSQSQKLIKSRPDSIQENQCNSGIKRKLDKMDQVEYPQPPKIGSQSQKLIMIRPDLVQENQRLERINKILGNENRELREKLDLLSKILKDPRKRDMLNARLARMQTAAI